MRIVFFTDPLSFEKPGGAEIYILNLIEGLNNLGIEAHIYPYSGRSLKDYDVGIFVNSFEYSQLALRFVEKMKSYGKIVLNAPIYYDISCTLPRAKQIMYRIGLALTRTMINLSFEKIFYTKLEYVILSMKKADLVLVSGESEKHLIVKHFGIDKHKVVILPVPVSEMFMHARKDEFKERYGIDDMVLTVANIMPRKNLHRLIVAYGLSSISKPLVVIGHVYDEGYFELLMKLSEVVKRKCKKEVYYLGSVTPRSSLLASAYASCRVFALPSFYETPGISALEAALAGANIVITQYGTTREYFRDYAFYVNPFSVRSIGDALEKAFRADSTELKEYVRNNFSATKVAQKLISIIERLW